MAEAPSWLQRLEHRIVERHDATSCLVFVQVSLPALLLIGGLQMVSMRTPQGLALYADGLAWRSLLALQLLILWQVGVGLWASRRQTREESLPGLVQAAVVPMCMGMALLAVGFGHKDTPMSMVMMVELVFARALFSLWQLRWAYLGTLLLLVVAEVLQAVDALPYAPLLHLPVRGDGPMPEWWALWVRVLFAAASFPFSGALFFLAATLRRHRRQLETLVRTDMLTGLPNRREFMARLEREAHRQSRNGRPLSVVMMDVDHFKQVNDHWGHQAGDEVLARIGKILQGLTREQIDVAARYGGEEFVLLLPETELQGAVQVAEKISARLREQAFDALGAQFRVTQSVGVAEVVDGQAQRALQEADRNLYQAKREGRDRIVASVAPTQSNQDG
jgi:diguanylate cyclase (GGDEF)-like protein